MALKPLNSVGGFSVGEVPSNVIYSNGDFSGNKANFSGNLAALGVLTDNLYYANGTPWDLQEAAGSNTQIQFNDNNNFGASANFTFNSTTNVLTVTGNIGAGNITASTLTSNVANGTAPLTVTSTTLVSNLNADLLDGYNSATANTANTVAVRDASGNISANYFIGNGAFLTGIDASLISNGNSNVAVAGNGNVTISVSGNAGIATFTGTGANISGYANVTGNVEAGGVKTDNLYYANGTPWDLQEAAGSNTQIQYNDGSNNFGASANLTYDDATQIFTVLGNADFSNADLGNLATANFVNVSSNLVSSNVTVNLELSGNTANFSGNIVAGNISTSGSGGNISGANVVSANTFTGTTVNAGLLQNGNSNVTITANSNIAVNANGINVITVSGYSGNASNNLTNIAGELGVSGNVTAPNFIGNVQGNISGNIVIPGSNTGVVYNDAGNANSSLAFTFDNTTNAVGIVGNISLGAAGTNQLVNNSNTSLDVRGGYGNATNANLRLIAGDGANSLNWSAIRLQGNLSGNSAIINESVHTFWRQPTQAANVVVIDTVDVNSSSTSTGALQVGGGIGATGNVNIGGALSVTGNIANANNISATNTVFANAANIAANLTAGNANLGNLAIANFVQTGELLNGNSNIRLAANGNIGISVTGNSNVVLVSGVGANIVGYVQANGAGTFGSLVSPSLTSNSGALTLTAEAGNNNVVLVPTGTGNVNVSGRFINSVADPSNPQDAATKSYVDSVATGLQIHPAVRAYSATNLNATYANGGSSLTTTTISGGTTITFSGNHGLSVDDELYWSNSFNNIVAQNGYFVETIPALNQITVRATYTGAEVTDLTNGTGLTQAALANPGVGATLTNAGANAAISIDSISLSSTNRVLVTGQTNQFENGVYTVSTVGNGSTAWVLTRATDGDQYAPTDVSKLGYGDYFFVSEGAQYAGSSYVLTTPTGEIVFGITNIAFSQFSAAGSYTAGNGIAINGTVISANVDNETTAIVAGNIVVKTSANLVTPNIGAAVGNSLSITGNLLAANVNANTLITAPNAEFTSNVLANNLTANSNITANNATINLALAGNTANFSGNVILPNLTVNLQLAGNTANFSGNVYANYVQAGPGAAIANLTSPVFGGIANANSFIQAYVHNESAGPAASADFIAYPNNGDDISGWIDLGITSNTFNAAAFTVTEENEGYLFMSAPDSSGTSGNLVFATDSTGTFNSIEFFVDGFNKTKSQRSALIDTSGLSVFGNTVSTGVTATGVGAIKAGVTNTILPNTIASFSANVNSYSQVTLQNKSTGADATADYIVTADNGSDTVNFIDLGVINSGYDVNTPTNSLGNIVFAADSYLYAQGNSGNASQSGGNLAIGTTVAGKNVKIFAGGANNSAIVANISNLGVNVSGRLNATGNLGVANANLGNIATANFFSGDGGLLTNVAASGSLANGTSNVTIPVANGNVIVAVNGNTNIAVFTDTGANITGYANITGNANVANLGTGGLITANGNVSGGNLTTTGQVVATGNVSGGNITTANTVTANTVSANVNVAIGNTNVRWGTLTTTAITANQTIATLSTTGVTGVEFLVKGIDSSGTKYSVATVQAVTDGTTVDYSIFGGVNLGTTTGTLAVNVTGGNLDLQVTPASTNSTVWTTQFRVI
jgi:hypothetical protein